MSLTLCERRATAEFGHNVGHMLRRRAKMHGGSAPIAREGSSQTVREGSSQCGVLAALLVDPHKIGNPYSGV